MLQNQTNTIFVIGLWFIWNKQHMIEGFHFHKGDTVTIRTQFSPGKTVFHSHFFGTLRRNPDLRPCISIHFLDNHTNLRSRFLYTVSANESDMSVYQESWWLMTPSWFGRRHKERYRLCVRDLYLTGTRLHRDARNRFRLTPILWSMSFLDHEADKGCLLHFPFHYTGFHLWIL